MAGKEQLKPDDFSLHTDQNKIVRPGLVQAGLPMTAVLRCVRFFTAPLRALSPTGLFTAIASSPVAGRHLRKQPGAVA